MGTQQKTAQLEKEQVNKIEEAKPQCGIIMPISAIEDCSSSHWGDVRRIIDAAIVNAGYVPNLVSDANDTGVIQKRIVQNIYDNEIVVCDVSCRNPNVMFELGMRLAFDKPTVIIMDSKTNFSFDTSIIEHLIYPRDLSYFAIIDFQEKLTEKIKGTIEASKGSNYTTFLKHFGEFKVASIDHTEGSLNEAVLSQLKDINNLLQVLRPDSRFKTVEQYRMVEPYHRIGSESNSYASDATYALIKARIDEYCVKNNTNIRELRLLSSSSEKRVMLLRFVEKELINRALYVPRENINEMISAFLDNPV